MISMMHSQEETEKKMYNNLLSNQDLHPALRIFHWMYSKPTDNIVLDQGTVVAKNSGQQGVRQGCKFGTAAFCLSVNQIFKNTVDNVRTIFQLPETQSQSFLLMINSLQNLQRMAI